jgi:hypothetical protein
MAPRLQGDFTLVGGTDPTDWFTRSTDRRLRPPAQRNILLRFDNGDDAFLLDFTYGATGAPSCYSTVRAQIDERR